MAAKATFTKLTANDLSTDTTSKVLQEVEKEMTETFAKDTVNILKKDFDLIKKNAEKLLAEIEREEKVVRMAFANTLDEMKANNPKQRTSLEFSLALAKKKALYFQHLLTKAYEFIEKTRKLITGTEIEYLVEIVGEKGERVIKRLILDELAPAMSLAVSSNREIKLQIARMNAMNRFANTQNEEEAVAKIRDSILAIYDYLTNTIKTYVNKKGKAVKILPGFAFETAVRAAKQLKGLDISTANSATTDALLDAYRRTIGNKAFYRGGDLKAEEIPSELIGMQKEQIEYQLKRIKATEDSLGAQVVTVSTIKRVLRVLIILIGKNFASTKDTQRALNHFLFEADKNITKKMEEQLTTMSANEINKVIESALK